MKKLHCIICDGCRKVIPAGLRPIVVKGKKGQELHFCEKVECQQAYNKPKKRSLSALISDAQAAEFIHHSNAIEEIHYTPTDALLGWQKKQSKIVEISGQVSALNYVMKHFKQELSIEIVCKVHKLLMKGLLPPWYLGLRRDWVRVGSRLCPPPSAVKPMLQNWCDKVNSLKNPTEEEIWQTHLAYESIHPFIDCNGRSGRLFWIWLRYKYGYNYAFVSNDTKFELYYPQFDPFNFETWFSTSQ